MKQAVESLPSFHRSGSAMSSTKPPRPAATNTAGGHSSSSAPKHEAEVASFLLQLKRSSPSPCRSHDKFGDESNDKDAYQSYRYWSPGCDHFSPTTTTPSASNTTRSSSLLSFSTNPTNSGPVPWETLLNQSTLVFLKDRDLVPDALFVAMAQMQPCRLTHNDRVGCYKTRPIGYLGLCCAHCGGQPGFGRFYPNSVRSLAQTTTSQTILKHVTTKCRFCPDDIRHAILDFQRLSSKENSPIGRPRYGSRKIFFQRIWQRLHHQDGEGEGTNSSSSSCCDEEETTSLVSSSKLTLDDGASNETPSDLDEEQSLATYSNDTIDDSTALYGGGVGIITHHKQGSHWSHKHQVKVTSPVHRLTAD